MLLKDINFIVCIYVYACVVLIFLAALLWAPGELKACTCLRAILDPRMETMHTCQLILKCLG